MRHLPWIVGAFLLWNVVVGLAVRLLPPAASIALGSVLFAGFLEGFVLGPFGPRTARRRADLRLRPLRGAALRATLAAVPVLLVLGWALSAAWTRVVRVPPEVFRPFEELAATRAGLLAVTLLAVVAAPVLEEMVFRGVVQRPLERRLGAAPGIVLTALLFALFHFAPWVLPLHLFLGLAFGFAVYATRSIWAGVVLHAANNTAAVLQMGGEPQPPVPTVWETGPTPELWTALGVLLPACGAAAWVARWMWRAGRRDQAPDAITRG